MTIIYTERALKLHNSKYGSDPNFRAETITSHCSATDDYLILRNADVAIVRIYRVRNGKLQHVAIDQLPAVYPPAYSETIPIPDRYWDES